MTISDQFDCRAFADRIEAEATAALSAIDRYGADAAAALAQELAEEMCNRHVEADNSIACRAGCQHCCIVNVSVLPPEAERISRYLQATRTDTELAKLVQVLEQLDRETRWLDDEERIMVKRSCAFLDASGSCSIYPVRPLLCRALTSINAESCREAMTMVAFDENRPIIANLIQQQIFETAFSSLASALEQQHRSSRSLRLAGSVYNLLIKSPKGNVLS